MRLLSGTALLCLALSAAFAAAPPAKVPAAWLKLIEQLGDDDEAVRKAARLKLEALGEDALPALRKAGRRHADADVRLGCVVVAAAIERTVYRDGLRFVGHTDGVYNVAVSP